MRELIVPVLRDRWPTARIVHEFPLRYSANRIDLGAITETEIIAVEIKATRDTHGVTERLAEQVRAFTPIAHRIIFALAPKWAADDSGARRILSNMRQAGLAWETWRVSAEAGTVDTLDAPRWFDVRHSFPWPWRLLDLLWAEELREIAVSYRVLGAGGTQHDVLRDKLAMVLTGRQAVMAACCALRGRAAFAAGSDPPVRAHQEAEGQARLAV